MTASFLSARYTYLPCLFIVSVLGIFSTISNAATTQPAETQPTSLLTEERQEQISHQLIGVMYTNQQMQLEMLKEQNRQQIEKVRDELSEMSNKTSEFQSDLDSQKLALEAGRQDTAAVGKRVDDSLIYAGQSLDRFSMGITFVLALAGVIGYISFAEKTRREARDVAEKWFENRGAEIQQKITNLEQEFIIAKNKISEHVDAIGKFAEESKAEIQRNGTIGTSDEKGDHFDLSSVVQQRAELLKDIPIRNYKYDDWNSLAYASYSNGKFEEAALYWLSASEVTGASDIEVALSIFNRGIVQSKLNQLEAAVKSYDEVIYRFGDATVLMLKEYVSKAFVNKGFLHGQLNQHDEEVGSYDEVVRRFGDEIEIALKIEVAKALYNKGVVLGKLNKRDVAVDTYYEVIHRFSSANKPELNKFVCRAHNGIGFSQLCKGKLDLVNNDPVEAEVKFNQALDHFDTGLTYLESDKPSGIILGNRAYALALLGELKQAEDAFAVALRSPADGGEELYRGTLTDFDIHPVAQDEPMRALVDRQWQLWLTEHGHEYSVV